MYATLFATPLKIGVPIPLTGNSAAEGTDVKNAFTLAIDLYAKDLLEPIFEDEACSPTLAAIATEKLLSVSNVDLITGFTCSGSTLAAAPIAERHKKILMAISASSPAITNAGEYIYRLWPSDTNGAKNLLTTISNKTSTLGIVSEETPYCIGLLNAIKENNKANIKINEISFITGTVDYKTIVAKMKNFNVSTLLLNTQSEQNLISVYSELQRQNFHPQILGNYYPGATAFLNKFKSKADGIIFSDAPSENDFRNPEAKGFINLFIQKFGAIKSIPSIVTVAAAGVQILAELAKSPTSLKEQLDTKIFNTILGPISFDKNGDVVGVNLVLKKIQNGAVVSY